MHSSSILDLVAAGPPPPGTTSDFENGEEYGVHMTLVRVIIACIVISSVAIVLRMVARIVVLKAFGWFDVLSILGYIFAMAFMGVLLAIDEVRRGRHMWDMTAQDFLSTNDLQNVAAIMYCIGVTFLKISILLLFLSVFAPSRRGIVYWMNIMLMAVNTFFYVGIIASLVYECTPRAKITNPTLPGKCIDVYMTYLLTAIFNVLSDFFILVFPIWAIWTLHMPNNRKFCSSVAFTFGTFAFAASIIRLHETLKIPQTSDTAWVVVHVGIWSSAEITCVFLCCCFPFLPKLIRLVKRKKWPKNSNGSDSTESKGQCSEHSKPGGCEYAMEVEQDSNRDGAPRKPEGIYSPV